MVRLRGVLCSKLRRILTVVAAAVVFQCVVAVVVTLYVLAAIEIPSATARILVLTALAGVLMVVSGLHAVWTYFTIRDIALDVLGLEESDGTGD